FSMSKVRRQQPWWLESGHERCSACGHAYVLETGYYCVSCDGTLCSICAETISVSVLCAACKCSEQVEA
ncbi:MAG TPA: hypothetical protein VFB82_17570, partial [Blastocatellia bacterium]|nr:hypothetical protein [Blastocatellia bacterium]